MAVEVEKLLVRLEAQTAQYNSSLLKAQQLTNQQLAGIENRFATMSKQVRGSTSSMAMGVTGALGAIGGALGTAAVVEYANAWTRLTRSIDANSSVFGIALRDAQALTDLANEARVDVEAYGKLYVRTSAAIRDYGFEAGTAEKVTSTLAKALKLGGAAASEQASVLLQFSQALQKGKLDGDEFRSVMENAGVVQELLAKRLNVTKGQIIELAAAGKLRINDLVGAMVDGANQVDRLYQRMPQTIDEAFAVLRNNVVRFIGEADQANGASQRIAGGIVTISNNLEALAVVIGAILGSAALRMAAFAAATVGAGNPVTLLAAAVGGLATAYGVYGDKLTVTEDGTVSLKAATTALFETMGETKVVKDLSAALDKAGGIALKSARAYLTFSAIIAKGLGVGTGSSVDDFFAKVEERARDIQMRRNIEAKDFGKLIRDAQEGRLEDPSKRRVETGTQDAAKATEFSRTMKQIRERTALLEAEAQTIGQTVFAQEKARAAADLRFAAAETAAKQKRSVKKEEIDAIEALSNAYAEAQVQAEFLNALQQARETEIALRNEIELVGLFGEELYRARNEQELLNAARRAGVTLTPELEAQISQQAAVNAMLQRQRELQIEIQATAKEALTSFISDMRQGMSATEALGNSLNKLADKLIEMAVSGLVESALGPLLGGGGGGSSGGSLLRAIGLADGGLVRGPGTGRSDSIPARLSNGEYVVNAAATRQNLPLLEAINSKGAAKFADGGLVSPLPSAVMPNLSRPATSAPAAPAMNLALSFNVQNGTPEGVEKLKSDVVPQIKSIVRQEIGQIFDRERRFTRSGL
ncbi:MAG: tape measure protein [Hyphomicrobium sp.]|nr:tape measure protein [Hyphomicrobium sp.]